MPLFALATLIYIVIGSLVLLLFRDNPISLISEMLAKIPDGLSTFLAVGWWVVPIFLIFALMVDRNILLKRLSNTILSAFICTAFFTFFTILKTTMPMITPFWADPFMVKLDNLLHFGVDPWVLTHAVSDWIPIKFVVTTYYNAWLLPAMYLPVLLAMFDTDAARTRRFILLYIFTWVGLGNLFALGFLSAGPVYFDRLYGGAYFAPLLAGLDQAQISASGVGRLIDHLWMAYESGAQQLGSGISAFPSVHVGMATVFALYLFERHRYFLPLSITIAGTYQFLSVYQGWHYAIDGYFSILAIVALWGFLRRRSPKSQPDNQPDDQQAPIAAS